MSYLCHYYCSTSRSTYLAWDVDFDVKTSVVNNYYRSKGELVVIAKSSGTLGVSHNVYISPLKSSLSMTLGP